jgi:hypothetical protein
MVMVDLPFETGLKATDAAPVHDGPTVRFVTAPIEKLSAIGFFRRFRGSQ